MPRNTDRMQEAQLRFIDSQRRAREMANTRTSSLVDIAQPTAAEIRMRQEIDEMRAEYETRRNVMMALEMPSAWASPDTRHESVNTSSSYASFDSLHMPQIVELRPDAWASIEHQLWRSRVSGRNTNPNMTRHVDRDELPE